MSDSFAHILSQKKSQVASSSQERGLSTLKALADENGPAIDLVSAISETKVFIIGECWRSAGAEYDPFSLATQYQKGGASAISVVTDGVKSGGSIDHLKLVRESVPLPVIMRDYIVDEYQVYEARAYGADSFWLSSALLDLAKLQYFIEVGREFEMEAIVEVSSEQELDLALKTDGRLLCINSPEISMVESGESSGLADLCQKASKAEERTLLCETVINTPQDVVMMHRLGYKAFIASRDVALHPDPAEIIATLVAAQID